MFPVGVLIAAVTTLLLILHFKLQFSLANISKQTAFLVAVESHYLDYGFCMFCVWRPPYVESATLSSHAQLVQCLALQRSDKWRSGFTAGPPQGLIG